MMRNDVIDVLSVVAAATRRTVGETDVEIWEGIIGDHDVNLALRAVRDHLRECPGVWLEPGHVRQRIKAMVADQRDREPVDAKLARMEAITAKKIAYEVDVLAGNKSIPVVEPQQPQPVSPDNGPNPLLVRCDWCHASPGNPCTTGGKPMRLGKRYHPTRLDDARKASTR